MKNGVSKKNDLIDKMKVIGPVDNLEDYVKRDWWKEIFNAYYLRTDGDVVNDDDITRQEIDSYLKVVNLEKTDSILDMCCGQGRHCFELARRGFLKVHGLDRSRYLIQRARKSVREMGLPLVFKEGDARKHSFPEASFDCVSILGNSFGYFENLSDDIKVLKSIQFMLKPNGKIFLDVADGEYLKDNFEPRSWEWIDKDYFVCRERSLSLDKTKLISREVITHAQKGVIVDQFYAERLYSKEHLNKILEHAGFSGISFHDAYETVSKRNQDLGMMKRRMLVTAKIHKDWPSRIKLSKKLTSKNVVVLLGDPRKSDHLKPSEVFDEDDYYTINQLKHVLSELKGYSFKYLDDHNKMISDLTKYRGQTDYVLNLCDEGFFNDPRKELHVPSMLEMLNVPYTGSNPQCLAFCYDKSLIRGIAREMDISVPDAFYLKPSDNIYEMNFPFPVIIKPNMGDSSFGITQRSVANNLEEMINAIDEIRNVIGSNSPIIVEEFLPGKDLSIGMIGNLPDNINILPLIEEDYSALPDDLPQICGYEAKWDPNSPYWNIKSIQADIPEAVQKYIEESSLRLFERLECRDYCRFDWRLDNNGDPHLLEVNPNPGWCWDGHLARMCKFADISYRDMLHKVLLAAEERIGIPEIDMSVKKDLAQVGEGLA
ncbi:MAG: methyltransferase domain-containing protein [Candidatus Omnitrophica bacterium]|nr:methyltransferase domain-containing protein [Candidatus Omnitrophota bacterium]